MADHPAPTLPRPASTALSAPVDLHPLTTGELIDRGFTLYRAHFAGFLLLALLCQIVPFAISRLLIALTRLPPATGAWSHQPDTNPSHLAILGAIGLVCQVFTFAFEIVMTAYLSQAYLGQAPSIKNSLRRLTDCLRAALATSVLNILLVGATLIFPILAGFAIYLWATAFPPHRFSGLILLLAGSLALLVASIVPVLIVFVRLMVTVPVVALEGLSGWKAVRRSSLLVRYDPGLGFLYWGEMRLSFLLLPLFVIELLVLSLTSLPVTLHQLDQLLRHGAGGQIVPPSDTTVILTQILTFMAVALLLPLYSIATTLFYYDVRIRREGFDLEFMAHRLEAAP